MKWAMVATWRMAFEGVEKASEILSVGGNSKDAIEESIKMVEDYPFYKSVGYGGLPNEHCEVELDGAFMDGDTLSFGAIGGIKDFKNPISIARKLSMERFNCFLVGEGAEEYAKQNGFEQRPMLTKRAETHYKIRKRDIEEKGLSPYDGHDTVGIIALDSLKSMTVGTSTSGLFMKKRGRVGDSPVSGSGFYVDSEIGGATATGLGEDIMKGCLSYEIVRLMSEGLSPQKAADKALNEFIRRLKAKGSRIGEISVVALNKQGEFGVATNIKNFSFVYSSEEHKTTVYLCENHEGETTYEEASVEWLEAYSKRIKEELFFD